MRKASLLGLVAAGSLVIGATGASAASNSAFTSSAYTSEAGIGAGQAYPAPVGASIQKKRSFEGALPWIIALAVGGAALFVALDDNGDGSPGSP